MFDRRGARGTQRQGPALARESVVPFCLRAFPPDGPERVAQMLLHQRNLRLHSQHDIAQRCLRSPVWGHARQDPGAAFLIHQATGSVDRIHDDPPRRFVFRSAVREHHLAPGQAFGDEDNREMRCDMAFKKGRQFSFTDAVDLINRILVRFVRDIGEMIRIGLLTGRHDAIADLLVQLTDGGEKDSEIV